MAGPERFEDRRPSVIIGRKRSIAMTEDGESGDYCRICRGESTPEQPLFHPCKCSGSIKYVHQECLMEWLSHSQKKYCELCKTPFRFTKLYDQSMPDRLPLPLFLHQLILHGWRRLARGLRYVLVVFVWFFWLPWSIRQVWRGLFWLADGSWMTPQDLHNLVAAASAQNNSNTIGAALNSTVAATAETIDAQTDAIISQGFAVTVFNLLSGDALLRGLLRLIAYKSSTPGTSVPAFNLTSTSYTSLIPARMRSSILADVLSLNSFTRYPVINNALIDLVEGQLVCLAVIVAFILVFLIREWVVNQQPVHHMPDPDQAEAPAAPANQDDNGRQQGGRRRRVAVRPPQNGDVHVADRPLDIANRPRAIPRPRRAVTDDNIGVSRENAAGPVAPPHPVRADSLQAPSTSSFAVDGHSLGEDDSPSSSQYTTVIQSLQSPPLQRGIFDDVVDIRRHIEEHSSSSSSSEEYIDGNVTDQITSTPYVHGPAPLQSFIEEERLAPAPESPSTSTSTSLSSLVRDEVTTQDSSNDSLNPANESELGMHVETQEREAPVIHDQEGNIEDDPTWEIIPVTAQQAVTNGNNNDSIPDQAIQPTAVHGHPDSVANTPPAAPRSLSERLMIWLWDTDQYRPQPAPVPTAPVVEVLDDHAQAPFVPVNAPAGGQQPVIPPAPVPGPEMQWGIDINEPNAMDDLEDVEGILELIGMEGPIAGMFQNFIFSVFLISLTLAASVWCPYIWGKISLLIMSSPISVFFKAPLFFISNVADILIDLMLLAIGFVGCGLTSITRSLERFIALCLPASSKILQFKAIEDLALSVTLRSSTRLEKALSVTIFHLRPDLPTFSIQSHHVLRVFKKAFFEATAAISSDVLDTIRSGERLWHSKGLLAGPLLVFEEIASMPMATVSTISKCTTWFKVLSKDLRMPPMNNPETIDYSLLEWTAKDRILSVIAGYVLFVLVACAYLQIAHKVYGLKSDEKVGGIFADSLRQAGGVVKVIVIIGIEMILFPLYCGCLLDVALLPLFRGATISNRVLFVLNAPITGIFVHWFLGTCYMFHFALFVSMCRKILRKGVLYFIRDPDDPTFHPVRDVLERPVASQLSKIAFSAGVYGGLVLICLGSVIWTLSNVSGIFPIEWTASEPRLAFPVDIISFNFILPFIAKRVEPSKKISSVYEWWFRSCARKLRLSHFLFGKEQKEEMIRTTPKTQESVPRKDSEAGEQRQKGENQNFHDSAPETRPATYHMDGIWVRAPATDSVRIPKGTKVFLEVDENNNRIDGATDRDQGLHGRTDERFIKIYIPSNFRTRICVFVFLVWLFAACTGATFAIVPLLLGRKLIHLLAGIEKAPNDLYAFTIGMHVCAALAYLYLFAKKQQDLLRARSINMLLNFKENTIRLCHATKYALGLVYIATAFGIVLPMLLSLLAELYIHMPIYNYLTSSTTLPSPDVEPPAGLSTIGSVPTVYLIQAWTLGILYLRILLRVVISYPNSNTRAATAIKAIIRNGLLNPDVRLATRAFILPTITITIFLLTFPLCLGKVFIIASNTTDKATVLRIFRYSYSMLLTFITTSYFIGRIHGKVEGWQIKVRDEVYLVGERLHNFSDTPSEPKNVKVNLPKDQFFASNVRVEEAPPSPPPQYVQATQPPMQIRETDPTLTGTEPSDLDFRGLEEMADEGSSIAAQSQL